MTHIIEITALVTGLVVIIIETVIIFMLKNHIDALSVHLERHENLTVRFEKNIEQHLEHLNQHSHDLGKRVEELYCNICGSGVSSRRHKAVAPPKTNRPIKSPKVKA